MALTTKQQEFVSQYLIDFNATQAAIRAGYSEKTAYSIGWRLLRNVEIREEIRKRTEHSAMSAEEVLSRLSAMARGDFEDVLRFEEGVKMPFLDLKGMKDKGLLHLVKKFKYNSQGYPEVELYDAKSALDTLAQCHGLLKENVNVSGALEVGLISVNYRTGIETGPDEDIDASGED